MMHGFGDFAGLSQISRSRSHWRMASGSPLPPPCPQAAPPSQLSSFFPWASWRASSSPYRCGLCAVSPHPSRSLATAAERLGHDVNAPPLAETGTTETRQAARAFNDMQTRLRSLIENRTRLLAAISHDLRTPLTLLRLRAETVENAQERDKMLATITEMDSLIGATLQFARDENASEPRRPTDLTALLQSVVDEMSDAACPVRMQPAEPIVYACQPAALKRAVRNLLDNAVKYGKTGSVEIR